MDRMTALQVRILDKKLDGFLLPMPPTSLI